MRNTQILFAAAGAVLIGFAGFSHAAPAASSPPPPASTDKAGNNTGSQAKSPVGQQQQRPFYCFGDAACEREMARLGRPVADQKSKQRDETEGPYINGVPGQTN